MKVLFSLVTLFAMTFTSVAQAQMWGAGVYGGAQACGYMQEREPEGIRELKDEIDDLKNERKDLRKDLRDAQKDLRDLERDVNRRKEVINQVLKNNGPNDQGVDAAGAAISYIESRSSRSQNEYTVESICGGGDGALAEPWSGFCSQSDAGGGAVARDRYSLAAQTFHDNIQEGQPGRIYPRICDSNSSQVKEEMRNADRLKAGCRDAISELPDLLDRKAEIEARRDFAQGRLSAIDRDIRYLQDELKEERREARRNRDEGDTEADYCYSCNHPNDRPVSTTQQIGSLLLGGLGAYLGYKGAQSIRRTNANLGWPTHPGLAVGAAMPGVMFGIYGATYGFGNQGCAGGFPPGGMGGPGGLYGPGGYPMGGGAFGYPAGYGGLGGGGLFMPGYGYPGGGYGGYPGGGMFAGGIVGAIGGMMAPYAGGGYMGGMAPYAGGMYMGGMAPYAGGMMAPYSGGAFAGGIVGAIGGMMAPYAGGGYMGGMAPYAGGMYMGGMAPYAGGPVLPYPAGGAFAGGIAGGIGGMMAPYAGGMYAPYAGGIAGAIGGGYPLAPYAGGAMGGGFAGMQYQQAMLQQQQAMLQYQMQAQQDYMNRQQMVGRLTSQMYQIQMQIQQISSGVYGGGYSGGGFGSGGPTILPYPSTGLPGTGGGTVDPNLNQTPIPSRGF